MLLKINFLNLSPKSSFRFVLQIRFAHYIVNQDGEKVVVSKNNHVRSKREKWQYVRPMGFEKELKKINMIERNERLHCDPKQACQTAQNKFQELSDYLRSSGFCRETKGYQPPHNTNEIINNICKEFFDTKDQVFKFDSIIFSDLSQKFKFLARCYQEFDHEVSNSELHSINSIKDVKNYYSTPLSGTSKYDILAFRHMNLPRNLNVIPEPIRFNPKTDTFFDGINAFPGSTLKTVGLRAKKKYPSFEDNFIWPDV